MLPALGRPPYQQAAGRGSGGIPARLRTVGRGTRPTTPHPPSDRRERSPQGPRAVNRKDTKNEDEMSTSTIVDGGEKAWRGMWGSRARKTKLGSGQPATSLGRREADGAPQGDCTPAMKQRIPMRCHEVGCMSTVAISPCSLRGLDARCRENTHQQVCLVPVLTGKHSGMHTCKHGCNHRYGCNTTSARLTGTKRPFNKELTDYARLDRGIGTSTDGVPYERRMHTNSPLSDRYE